MLVSPHRRVGDQRTACSDREVGGSGAGKVGASTYEHLLRIMLERTFLTFYQRSVSFVTDSPKERYASLIETQPEVLQRATQYHIASYLGITPQHLSRLRGARYAFPPWRA